MRENQASPTLRILDDARRNRPTVSKKGIAQIRTTRQLAEAGAATLASGRCHLQSILSARAALTKAEGEVDGAISALIAARSDVEALEREFSSVCVRSGANTK
jgi:hypothetical protein